MNNTAIAVCYLVGALISIGGIGLWKSRGGIDVGLSFAMAASAMWPLFWTAIGVLHGLTYACDWLYPYWIEIKRKWDALIPPNKEPK